MERAQDRLDVLRRAEEYERNGWFDRDLENDPPTRLLRPGEVDYLGKKLSTRIASAFANRVAKHHFDGCIKRGELIIKEIRGLENYRAIKEGGAVLTANHFNPFDNYAVYKAIEPELGKHRLYKVIREGNFTSFPGLYGFFFRHCNTLPLAADHRVLRECTGAIGELLARGEKILIYPEQAMWWNYRKPRPLKEGAFRFAYRAGVPVLPVFLTMEDTDVIEENGYARQAYTLHFLPAIYPDKTRGIREETARMCRENERLWRETYEAVYGIPLVYTTEPGKEG